SAASQDNRTTYNTAPAAGFDDETDYTATPAANGTTANSDDAQQRPAIPEARGFTATDFHVFHPGGKLGASMMHVARHTGCASRRRHYDADAED
ncbi:hypothetical protein ACC710_36720, partial [Rhizobium ruizarguesonis]